MAAESPEMELIRFSVPDMDCANCAATVHDALADMDGVESVEPAAATGRVAVTYDPDRIERSALVAAIEDAGYEVTGEDSDGLTARPIWTSPRALKTGLSAALLLVGLVAVVATPGRNVDVFTLFGTAHSVADVAFFAATLIGGEVILREGVESAWQHSLDIDFLMSVAILGAVAASLGFGEGLYFEAATLAVLFNTAELLEEYSMDQARNSLRELMDLSPDEARVRREAATTDESEASERASGEQERPASRDGEVVTVPAGDVRVGETVVVRPGEKIPVDGTVIEGESAVDQSPVTGESVPVDKSEGDEVYAGTLNEAGYLEIETTAGAGEHTLARIVELVEDAQAGKTDREQFVDRFAGYYTPLVVGLALVAMLGPPLAVGAAWSTWFVRGLTLLVLACPCAFVISTPVSVVAGITSAARNGVLIKGGDHLEAMGEVEAVALDKTGTITQGELTVTDVIPVNGNTEEEVLQCARGIEKRSEHPIGEAIVAEAEAAEVGDHDIEAFEALTGKGVTASVGGRTHYAGKPGLFEDLGFDLSHVHAATDGGVVTTRSQRLCERNDCLDLLKETIPQLQREGKTVIIVGTEDELEGVIAVADEIRPGAETLVERLHALGIEEVVMLTGDNERTARAIGEQVGIDDVRAELLPEEKVEAVRELDEEHDGVAMVGDGINDAPALATATVGAAMGAAGTDAAIETADIALLGDDLSSVPYLRDLSMRTNGVIKQNVWASLGVKAVLVALVPLGYPIWVAVLVGDAGMTVGITGNAMRLSRVKPE